MSKNTSCPDTEEIRRELAPTNGLYQKLSYIIVDVVSFSAEETASMVLNALNLEDHNYYSTEISED